MSQCEEYAVLISAAVDGELSPEERQRLDAHLAACPGCQADYQQLLWIHEALGQMEAQPPEDLASSVMEQVRREAAGSARRRRRHWISVGAAAACCAVVVLGARVLGTLSPVANQQPASPDTSVTTADAGGGMADRSADDAVSSVESNMLEGPSAYQAPQQEDPSLESALTYFGGGNDEDNASDDSASVEKESVLYCATVVTEDQRTAEWMTLNVAEEGLTSQDEESGTIATAWLITAPQYEQLSSYLLEENIPYTYTGEAEETALPADGMVRVVCLSDPAGGADNGES